MATLRPFGALEPLSSAAPWGIVPRKRLDIGHLDMAYGIAKAFTATSDRETIVEEIQELWTGEDVMVTLSVRTSFDLMLRALALPRGSEVIMSGVTIKDMVKIVEEHGLMPVPIDLKFDTLEPNMELLRKAVTPRSKVFIVAHIFGTRNNMDKYHEFCSEHGILTIEDCAEAYAGNHYKGNDSVDVSMFSFGTIKTGSALGGCVMRVKDDRLRKNMNLIHNSYTPRSRTFFARRCAKYFFIASALSPALYGALSRTITTLGGDVDETITSVARGFPGPDLFALIRKQPSIPLLWLLARRLREFNPTTVAVRREISQAAASMLKDVPGIRIPGLANAEHCFWLFPIMVKNPAFVCKEVSKAGFDVTSGTTQLGPVTRYIHNRSPILDKVPTPMAEEMMSSIVYLPITPELTIEELKLMVEQVKIAVAKSPTMSRL